MNRKLLVILFFVFLSAQAFSQIRKGQWLLGGDLNFAAQTIDLANYATVSQKRFLMPVNVGYFVADNIAVGLRVKYGYNRQDVSYKSANYRDQNYSDMSFGCGPYIRAYILPNVSSVNFLVEGSYQYGYAESTSQFIGLSATNQFQKTSDIMFAAGPVFFLNPNTSLECVLGYLDETIIDSDNKLSAFFIGIGFQLHLGKGKTTDAKFKK